MILNYSTDWTVVWGGASPKDDVTSLKKPAKDFVQLVKVAQAAPATVSDVQVDATTTKAPSKINPLTDFDKLAEQAYKRYLLALEHPEFSNSADMAKKSMDEYKLFSSLSPTIQAQARELEAKKTEANKVAEGLAETQTKYNYEATEFLNSYSKQLLQLQTLSKISQLAELNRLSDVKVNFASFLRELNVDHIGPFDLGNIKSANDTMLKNAIMQAMSEIAETSLSKAPNTALATSIKTIADPKIAPGIKYIRITQDMAKDARKRKKYKDWYEAGKPHVGKFSAEWEDDPAHSVKIFLQQADEENPYVAGITEGEKKQLLAQRKSVFDTSEDAEGMATASVALAGSGEERSFWRLLWPF